MTKNLDNSPSPPTRNKHEGLLAPLSPEEEALKQHEQSLGALVEHWHLVACREDKEEPSARSRAPVRVQVSEAFKLAEMLKALPPSVVSEKNGARELIGIAIAVGATQREVLEGRRATSASEKSRRTKAEARLLINELVAALRFHALSSENKRLERAVSKIDTEERSEDGMSMLLIRIRKPAKTHEKGLAFLGVTSTQIERTLSLSQELMQLSTDRLTDDRQSNRLSRRNDLLTLLNKRSQMARQILYFIHRRQPALLAKIHNPYLRSKRKQEGR